MVDGMHETDLIKSLRSSDIKIFFFVVSDDVLKIMQCFITLFKVLSD